ncbi:hypothetical protein VTO73DRAFT_485 [Trametes versicolor]
MAGEHAGRLFSASTLAPRVSAPSEPRKNVYKRRRSAWASRPLTPSSQSYRASRGGWSTSAPYVVLRYPRLQSLPRWPRRPPRPPSVSSRSRTALRCTTGLSCAHERQPVISPAMTSADEVSASRTTPICVSSTLRTDEKERRSGRPRGDEGPAGASTAFTTCGRRPDAIAAVYGRRRRRERRRGGGGRWGVQLDADAHPQLKYEFRPRTDLERSTTGTSALARHADAVASTPRRDGGMETAQSLQAPEPLFQTEAARTHGGRARRRASHTDRWVPAPPCSGSAFSREFVIPRTGRVPRLRTRGGDVVRPSRTGPAIVAGGGRGSFWGARDVLDGRGRRAAMGRKVKVVGSARNWQGWRKTFMSACCRADAARVGGLMEVVLRMRTARGAFVRAMVQSFEHDARSLRVWKPGGGFSNVVHRPRDMLEAVPPLKDEKLEVVRISRKCRDMCGTCRGACRRMDAPCGGGLMEMALRARNSRGAFVRATLQSYKHVALSLRTSKARGEVSCVVYRARDMLDAGLAAKGRKIKVVEIARKCREAIWTRWRMSAGHAMRATVLSSALASPSLRVSKAGDDFRACGKRAGAPAVQMTSPEETDWWSPQMALCPQDVRYNLVHAIALSFALAAPSLPEEANRGRSRRNAQSLCVQASTVHPALPAFTLGPAGTRRRHLAGDAYEPRRPGSRPSPHFPELAPQPSRLCVRPGTASMLDSTAQRCKLEPGAVDVGCVPGVRPRYDAGISASARDTTASRAGKTRAAFSRADAVAFDQANPSTGRQSACAGRAKSPLPSGIASSSRHAPWQSQNSITRRCAPWPYALSNTADIDCVANALRRQDARRKQLPDGVALSDGARATVSRVREEVRQFLAYRRPSSSIVETWECCLQGGAAVPHLLSRDGAWHTVSSAIYGAPTKPLECCASRRCPR